MGLWTWASERAARRAVKREAALEAAHDFDLELAKAKGLKPKKDKGEKGIGGEPKDPLGITEWTQDLADSHVGAGLVDPVFQSTPGPANKLTYPMLAAVAQDPFVAAIQATRVMEVVEFAKPAPDPYSYGFRVQMRDAKKAPTKAEQARCDELQKFVMHCGNYETSQLAGHKSLPQFMAESTRQTYTFDQWNFSIDRDVLGRPAGLQLYDPKTIRRAIKGGTKTAANIDYVQIWQNSIVAGWSAQDFCFGVRRPRSDLETLGYGYPEAEEIVRPLTHLLWAEDYNAAAFRQGALSEGILQLAGEMPKKAQRSFRRQFRAMMTGVHNAARMAIVNFTDPRSKIDLVKLKNPNKDMEFSKWIDLLIKRLASAYLMDPAELGWNYGTEGQSSALTPRSMHERIEIGLSKGLRPLLRFFEFLFNVHVIWQIDEDFVFAWAGMDSVTEKEKLELDKMSVETFKTVNELRAERDMEPDPDGDVILNPVYAQLKQGGADEGGFPGEDGDEGGFPPDDDQGDQDKDDDDKGPPGQKGTPKPPGGGKSIQPEKKGPPPPGPLAKKALEPRPIRRVYEVVDSGSVYGRIEAVDYGDE